MDRLVRVALQGVSLGMCVKLGLRMLIKCVHAVSRIDRWRIRHMGRHGVVVFHVLVTERTPGRHKCTRQTSDGET